MTSPQPIAAVGESVEFRLLRRQIDGISDDMICSATFEGESPMTKLFNESNRMTHVYSLPGSHRYVGECYSPTWNGALRSDHVINVETPLTLDRLNLTFFPREIPYLTPSVVSFSHNVAFPVTYRFAFGSSVSVKKKEHFLGPTVERNVVDFELDENLQLSMGPGEFPFTFFLNNSISSAEFTSNISMNQALENVNVTMDRFVVVSPNNFTINFHLAQGAPVTALLTIRKYPGIELESQTTGRCYFQCEYFTMIARAERGTHMLEVSLYNTQNVKNIKWGPFEALPQVYDAFVTSSSSVQVGHVMTVLAFIRADLGNYHLELRHEGRTYQETVDYYTTAYRHNLEVSLPFDPTKFVLVRKSLRFFTLGLNHIQVFVKNEKQTFSFKPGEVFVRKAPSCLKNVVINGPPMTSIANNVVRVSQKLYFRARVDLQCVDGNNLVIEWGVVPSQDPGTVPDLFKGYSIKSEKQGYEVDPNQFDPGYYVAIISVTTKKPRTYTPIDRAKRFLILHITGGRMIAFIEGGRIKEIGRIYVLFVCLRLATRPAVSSH